MTTQSLPIEVVARSLIASRAASLFSWERENSKNASLTRKEAFTEILEAIQAAGTMSDGDRSEVCSMFGAKAKQAGLKDDTIKVRKSELRRIMENIHLCTDATGWNSAIKAIREATTDRLELVRDEADRLLNSIDKAHEALNSVVSSLQEDMNTNRPANTPAYTIEHVAKMVSDAITAKHAGAKVQPINVASMLRQSGPVTADKAVPAATLTK